MNLHRLRCPPRSDGKLVDEDLRFTRLSSGPVCVCDQCGAVARSLHELALAHKHGCPDKGVSDD